MYKYCLILLNKLINHLLPFSEDLWRQPATLVIRSDTMTDLGISDTTNTSSSAMPLPGPGVHSMSTLKLPAFLTVDTSSWFRTVDIQFCLRKIQNSQTKANHVLAAISEDLFPQISEWLDRQGNLISYDDLKSYLLRCSTLSPPSVQQE